MGKHEMKRNTNEREGKKKKETTRDKREYNKRRTEKLKKGNDEETTDTGKMAGGDRISGNGTEGRGGDVQNLIEGKGRRRRK